MKCTNCGQEVKLPKGNRKSFVICPLCGTELPTGNKNAETAEDDFIVEGDKLIRHVGIKSDVFIHGNIRTVCASAFQKSNVEFVHITDGVQEIQKKAFADCKNLKQIFIPNTVTTIAKDAFLGTPDVTIVTPEGSLCYRLFYRTHRILLAEREDREPIAIPPINKMPHADDKSSDNQIPKIIFAILGILAALALVVFVFTSLYSSLFSPNSQGESINRGTEKPKVWSSWEDALPKGVTTDQYDIETRMLYSTREQETMSSTTSDNMTGWELYDIVEANGEFGPWSDWSATKVESSATREVDTQIRYRYRDKETTTSSSSTKDGWTKYDTTYSWGNYGSWSSWSTSAVSNSDSRKVETKTQYRYRNISYSTEYTGWSSWSSWQDAAVSETDLRDVETRTAYHYYYFTCSNCGKRLPGQNLCYSWDGGCGRSYTGVGYTPIRLTTPYSSTTDFGGVGMRYIYLDGDKVFAYTSSSSQYYCAPITQYRYRTRSTQQVSSYGSWSNWGDTAYSNSSSRQVETRKVYRYCDRSQVATYHFYRWGSWSDWSENNVSGSNDRQVEKTTYYRYRDQAKITTYYFRRWTDWTTYSENPVTESETREVQTKTQYRYKEK